MLVAALERSDNEAARDHAFAVLKRGYPRRKIIVQKRKVPPAAERPAAFRL